MTRRSLAVRLLLAAVGGFKAGQTHAAVPPNRKDFETEFALRRDTYLALVRSTPLSRFQVTENGTIRFVTPDPGKHLWNYLLALLAVDPSGDQALPGTPGVRVRQLAQALVRYPNMFHFNADGPAACQMRYPNLLTPEDRSFLMEGHPRSVLNHPEQPNYDLFTGEGTENHIAMSRFAGYLLCQDWLRDHPDDARAKQGLAQARTYILRHTRDVYRAGTGEYNSSTYYGYQMRGILTCFEFAADPLVRNACRALLDYFAAEIALKYIQGVNAGPESRGGDDRSVVAEMNQMVYLWFGDSPVAPSTPTNAVYAALSSYRPPVLLREVARKSAGTEGDYWNSHPTYLLDTPAAARESLYFGRGYALGCLYLPVAGYTGATEQFRPAKLVCRSREGGDSSAWVLFANSNSRTDHGGGRGPYDQWAHHRDTLIQITHVPLHAETMAAEAEAITKQWRADWLSDFQERWGGKGDSDIHGPRTATVLTRDIKSYLIFPYTAADLVTDSARNLLFLRHDDTYVAIRSLKNMLPTLEEPTPQSKPPGKARLIDPVEAGATGGFVLEVGTRAEDGAFEAFQKRVAERTELDTSRLQSAQALRYRNRRGEWVSVTYNRTASEPQIEPQFDWGYINDPAQNRPVPVASVPPLQQPTYPRSGASLDGWGRIPTVTVNGKPLGGKDFLNLKSPWPVFRGPNITLEKGILTIRVGSERYQVDHSGDAPRWTGT